MASNKSRVAWAAQSQINWALFIIAGAKKCLLSCSMQLDRYEQNKDLSVHMRTRCGKVQQALLDSLSELEYAGEAIRNINKEPS